MRNLNIKDDEAYDLATDLAKITGKSLKLVVRDALWREHRALTKAERAAKWRRIIAENRANMTDEIRDFDADAFLYDENGLPH